MAVALIRHEYFREEVVYQLHDHPFNIYLVMRGTFAAVGQPSPHGGSDVMQPARRGPVKVSPQDGNIQATNAPNAANFQESEKSPTALSLTKSTESLARRTFKIMTGDREKVHAQANRRSRVAFPYKLYSHKNYFGDFEVLMQSLEPTASQGHHHARNCSVRCESETGSVLVLGRQDLLALLKDFPHFGNAWYVAATSREHTRLRALARQKRGMACRHFAAYSIQRHWRASKERNTTSGTARRTSLRGTAWSSVLQGTKNRHSDHVTSERLEELAVGDIDSDRLDSARNASNAVINLRKDVRREFQEIKESIADLRSAVMVLTDAVLGPTGNPNPLRDSASLPEGPNSPSRAEE